MKDCNKRFEQPRFERMEFARLLAFGLASSGRGMFIPSAGRLALRQQASDFQSLDFQSLEIKRILLTLVLTLALLTGASPAKPHDTLAIGSPMPDFALPTVDGAIVQSPGFRGHTLVLNFCAFWCDTWKAEWPSLTELAQEQKNSDFQLVVVSIDGTRVAQFHRGLEQLQKHDSVPPFPVLLDAGGRVSARFGIAHVPTVMVIDASGRVRYVTEGYPGNAVVLHQVRTLQNARALSRG